MRLCTITTCLLFSFQNVALAVTFLHAKSQDKQAPIKVACMGDSITEGVPGVSSDSYPAQLQTLLGPSYLVQNFGRGWSSLMPPVAGVPAEVVGFDRTPQFQSAVFSHPDIIVLMLGTNDAITAGSVWSDVRSQAFLGYYTAMIQGLKALYPSPRVILGIPPPCYSAVGKSKGGNDQNAINFILPQLVRRVAAMNSLAPPIDVFGLFASQCPDFTKGDCKWLADGELHPNRDGYHQIASLVMKSISEPPIVNVGNITAR